MPMDKPRYTILVGVCKQATPESPRYFGIDLAGPVASDIMEYIYTNDPSLHYVLEKPEVDHKPKDIKAGKSSDIKSVSKALSMPITENSTDSTWGTGLISKNGNTTITAIEIGESCVPDVRGMGLSDALYLLESCGLKVTHTGSGTIKSQSIPAGREINKDDLTIHLNLGK